MKQPPTVRHATVWIDHKEAKIFHIEPEAVGSITVKAPHHHLTRKAEEQGRHALEDVFYAAVAETLKDVDAILVVGPSSGKLDFIRYLHKHKHLTEAKIVGVETLDHPSDRQLAAYIRHYFVEKAHVAGVAVAS